MEKYPPQMEKILIIQTAFLGDVILTTPLIRAVKQIHPQCLLSFLLIPETKEVLVNNPRVDEIILYDKRGKDKGITTFISLARRIGGQNFGKALVPHRSLRSAALCYLGKIPERTGFDRSAGSFLFTRKVRYQTGIHEVQRNLSLLSDFPSNHWTDFLPELFPIQEDFVTVEEFLRNNRADVDSAMIAIAPGSIWATKRWLPERFAQVADLLTTESKARIVFLGSKEDENLCLEISKMMEKKPIIAAGKISFLQSAALMSKCDVILSNDSAPVHMAVAMGTPVVEIYGSTVPQFGFFPCGDRNVILEKPLYCRPCGIHGKNKCPEKHFRCMTEITTQEVFEAIMKIVEK
jgi:heptosyltransferase-2